MTPTGQACQQPDCEGHIAPDGYCDTCGVPAPAAAAASPRAATAPAPTPAAHGHACQQPDCGGTVAADGYCNTCGLSPTPAAAPPSTSPAAAAPAPAASAVGTACTTTDCGGTVAADGYCNTCGLAPSTAGRTPTTTSSGATMAALSIAAPEAPGTSRRVQGAGGGQSTRRATGSRRTANTRARLGAGLISIEPTPVGDPSLAIMSPEKIASVLGEVPEADRHCSACGRPVGQPTPDKPGRVKGFCGNCRTPYDFVTNAPVLQAGDRVAGQYEILGPLAHGGMGWIYLGRDQAVSGRWVVLKGLLNSDDADAAASAVAERQYLAQIEHPNIVNIYNFVSWRGAGYIVMEFVGGESLNGKLKDRRKANNGLSSPLPATEAISYVLGVLPALGYLHSLGLVYNDLKPANVMATGDDVKLIDVGGVMRMDDHAAAIFGTAGFQAPEVASMGPSVASDLYTVGRTLAVLMLTFVFHRGEYEHAIPPDAVFSQHESLYRFLLKATASHPDDRFQDAEEMTEQLHGVLREVVARETGLRRNTRSTLFGSDRLTRLLLDDEAVSVTGADSRVLPIPRIDPNDPAAAFLADLEEADPQVALDLIQAALERGQIVETREVVLRAARAAIERNTSPETFLARVEAQDPWEWRVAWYRGMAAFFARNPQEAASQFSLVWTELPGEIAPKLATALAAEQAGEYARAADLYETVAMMDDTFVSAPFGLARCRAALGDASGAVEAYRQVPASSATYVDAQIASARAQLEGDGTDSQKRLASAASTVERLQLDATERAQLSTEILEKALTDMEAGTLKADKNVQIFNQPLDPDGLRTALESVYRDRARLSTTSAERYKLIDRANQLRPRSLI